MNRSNNLAVQLQYSISVLILILISTGCLLIISAPVVRILAGGILILFLPGSLFIRVLFPKNEGLDPIWRYSLILPTSIAIIGAILLLVNYFGVYDYSRLVLIVAILDSCLLLGLFFRRKEVPETRPITNWLAWSHKEFYKRQGLWQVLFVCSILVFLGAVVYAAWVPKKSISYTEFYVLTADRKLPFSMDKASSINSNVILGITNQEGRDIEYQVTAVAELQEAEVILWSGKILVMNGSNIEQLLSLPAYSPNTKKLQFYLFLDEGDSVPYRSLSILIQ